MAPLARWCFTHRFPVLALWIAGLLVVGGLSQAAGDQYNDSFSLPGTESTRALELLQKSFAAQSGDSDQIVFHVKNGSVNDPAVKQSVETMLAKVGKGPNVVGVVSPYSQAGASQVSKDGQTAYATVNMDKLPQDIPKESYDKLIDTAQGAATENLQVELGGNGIEQAEAKPPGGPTEFIGVFLAAIVLYIAFGSIFAMFLPLLSAIFALGVALATDGLLAGAFNIATFAPTLATLIGLGVGIDYALFIITRHRNGIKAGRTPLDAAQVAVDTSGRAVLFAGGTGCVALLGLLLVGVQFLHGVAIAASVTVLFTMLSATTLMPALLGIVGMRVLSRRERRQLRDEGPHDTHAVGFWARWAAFVQRRPVPLAVAATLIMVLLALPFLSLRLGSSDSGNDPKDTTMRKAYDLLAEGFGPGFNGQLQLVAQNPDKGVMGKLIAATKASPEVVGVSPAIANKDGSVAIVNVTPKHSTQDVQTSDLITHLRDDVVPQATRGSDTKVYVGGLTAIFDDFADVLTAKLPLFIGVIVLLGCLLLMIAFRSIVVPLTAAAMNLLAAGAAFGLVTAVFQKGWAGGLIEIGRTGPIEAFLPVLLLAIPFGLSLDYPPFLVSRMHEEWVHTEDNARSVRIGQADTGRVITAAATIMILVFGSFIFQGQRVISEFGVGLASAVFLDAFVLRTVLVPALMHRIGPANWWLPKRLDRALPHLSVDPPEPEAVKA